MFVGSLPPTFALGERNQYCNGCYIALGAIVEKVSATLQSATRATVILTT